MINAFTASPRAKSLRRFSITTCAPFLAAVFAATSPVPVVQPVITKISQGFKQLQKAPKDLFDLLRCPKTAC